jgi:hypothetical protein
MTKTTAFYQQYWGRFNCSVFRGDAVLRVGNAMLWSRNFETLTSFSTSKAFLCSHRNSMVEINKHWSIQTIARYANVQMFHLKSHFRCLKTMLDSIDVPAATIVLAILTEN